MEFSDDEEFNIVYPAKNLNSNNYEKNEYKNVTNKKKTKKLTGRQKTNKMQNNNIAIRHLEAETEISNNKEENE